jgi:hypothetical protein
MQPFADEQELSCPYCGEEVEVQADVVGPSSGKPRLDTSRSMVLLSLARRCCPEEAGGPPRTTRHSSS